MSVSGKFCPIADRLPNIGIRYIAVSAHVALYIRRFYTDTGFYVETQHTTLGLNVVWIIGTIYVRRYT